MLVRECASESLPSPSPLHGHPTIARISVTHCSSCSRTALAIINTRISSSRWWCFTSHAYRSSASSCHCSIRSETFASVATALSSNFISHSTFLELVSGPTARWSVLGTDSRSRRYCIDRDTVGISFVSNLHRKAFLAFDTERDRLQPRDRREDHQTDRRCMSQNRPLETTS